MYNNIRHTPVVAGILIYGACLACVPRPCAAQDAKSRQEPETQMAQTKSEGYELTIATAKKRFVPCEPIIVEVVLSNVTAGAVSLEEFGMANDYNANVTDANGKETPHTRYGEGAQIKKFGGGNRRIVAFQTGQSFNGYITVNQIFDMSLAGLYKITVEHVRIPKRGGAGHVLLVSPPVEIEVVEKPPFREAR